MHHSTRRLLRMGTTGNPGLDRADRCTATARADTLPGAAIRALQQSQASRQSAPVKADMVTACQTQSQATSATIDALRTRLQAARDTKDPTQMRAVLDEVLQQLTAMHGVHARWHGRPREGHHGMQHGS